MPSSNVRDYGLDQRIWLPLEDALRTRLIARAPDMAETFD
jgi:hypothetical protein